MKAALERLDGQELNGHEVTLREVWLDSFFPIYTIYFISPLLTLCTCTRSRLIRTVALTVDHVAALTVDLLLVVAVVALHLVPALDLLVVPLVVTVTMNVAALLPVIVQSLLNVRARTVMESEALVVTAVLAAAEVLLRKPSLTVADLDPLLLLLVKRKAISGKIHTFVLLPFEPQQSRPVVIRAFATSCQKKKK